MLKDGREISHDALEEMRVRAIEAYRSRQSVQEVAKSFGLHRGSVSRWITRWRRGGKRALRQRKGTGRPKRLDCQIYGKKILNIIRQPADHFNYEHSLWTCKRVKEVISRRLGLDVSIPTVWRNLKQLNLSCQKPERRAIEQDPVVRNTWKKETWPRIKRLAMKKKVLIFFEDESGIRLIPTVGRTWATVGQTPIVRVTGKRASICVMSAVSLDGKLFFSIPEERVNSDVFITFLKGLLEEYPKRDIFCIVDQASSHISKKTRKFVRGEKRLRLFYFPPYSPDFNPDEETWNHLKNHELKAHNAQNREQLRAKTSFAMTKMKGNPSLIRSFFYRSSIDYVT